MTAPTAAPPRWTTATIADATDSAPMELHQLGAHLERCNDSRSRWFALRCAVEAVHDAVAPRIVTTLLVAGGLIGLAVLVL